MAKIVIMMGWNKDNLSYPKHYASYGYEKTIDNETINRWVRRCIGVLESSKDNYYIIASGDSIVFVFWWWRHLPNLCM